MKLNVNFVYSAGAARNNVSYFLAVLIFASGFFIVYLLNSAAAMKKEMPRLLIKLETVKKELGSTKMPENMPSEADISKLQAKAAAINKLKINRSCGLTEILYKLEKITPEGVELTNFQYNLEDNSLSISGWTKNAAKISAFTKGLENEPVFSSVRLEKQSQKDVGDGSQIVAFTLKAEENTR